MIIRFAMIEQFNHDWRDSSIKSLIDYGSVISKVRQFFSKLQKQKGCKENMEQQISKLFQILERNDRKRFDYSNLHYILFHKLSQVIQFLNKNQFQNQKLAQLQRQFQSQINTCIKKEADQFNNIKQKLIQLQVFEQKSIEQSSTNQKCQQLQCAKKQIIGSSQMVNKIIYDNESKEDQEIQTILYNLIAKQIDHKIIVFIFELIVLCHFFQKCKANSPKICYLQIKSILIEKKEDGDDCYMQVKYTIKAKPVQNERFVNYFRSISDNLNQYFQKKESSYKLKYFLIKNRLFFIDGIIDEGSYGQVYQGRSYKIIKSESKNSAQKSIVYIQQSPVAIKQAINQNQFYSRDNQAQILQLFSKIEYKQRQKNILRYFNHQVERNLIGFQYIVKPLEIIKIKIESKSRNYFIFTKFQKDLKKLIKQINSSKEIHENNKIKITKEKICIQIIEAFYCLHHDIYNLYEQTFQQQLTTNKKKQKRNINNINIFTPSTTTVQQKVKQQENAQHRSKKLAIQEGCSKGIVHLDIKPQNIMKNGDDIVIIDFGESQILTEGYSQLNCGNQYYKSPEMRKGCSYDIRADVWSIGILVYDLFAPLDKPFYSSTEAHIINYKNRRIELQLQSLKQKYIKQQSDLFYQTDIIKECMVLQKQQRSTIQTILQQVQRFRMQILVKSVDSLFKKVQEYQENDNDKSMFLATKIVQSINYMFSHNSLSFDRAKELQYLSIFSKYIEDFLYSQYASYYWTNEQSKQTCFKLAHSLLLIQMMKRRKINNSNLEMYKFDQKGLVNLIRLDKDLILKKYKLLHANNKMKHLLKLVLNQTYPISQKHKTLLQILKNRLFIKELLIIRKIWENMQSQNTQGLQKQKNQQGS